MNELNLQSASLSLPWFSLTSINYQIKLGDDSHKNLIVMNKNMHLVL
jgi:hypothetical protein